MKKFLLLTVATLMAATCGIEAAFLSQQEQARLAASPWKAEMTPASSTQVPRIATTATVGARAASATSPFAAQRAARVTQMGVTAPAVVAPAVTAPVIEQAFQDAGSRVIESAAETPLSPEVAATGRNFASGLGANLPRGDGGDAAPELIPTTPSVAPPELIPTTPSVAPVVSEQTFLQRWMPSWLGGKTSTPAPQVTTEAAATESRFSKYMPTRESLLQRWQDVKTTAAETLKPITTAYEAEGFGAACKAAGGQFTSSVEYRPKTYAAIGFGALALGGYLGYRWYNQLERRLLREVQNRNILETDKLLTELTNRLNAAQDKPDYKKQANNTAKIFADAYKLATQLKEASTTVPEISGTYDALRQVISNAISSITDEITRTHIQKALELQPAEGKPGQLAPGKYKALSASDMPDGL